MSIKIETQSAFSAENSLRLFLDKTENKEFSDKIPFELVYWATKLNNKISSALKTPRESLQKLNDAYGITEKVANKPIKEVLGDKVAEFEEKRDIIFKDILEIDIYKKNISLFNNTGIGGYTLMGLLPFLEDDLEEKK